MSDRFATLDGWRGIAIIFVLAGHLLPLGPKLWQMNATTATIGMVIFFNLSGFLITNILLQDQNIKSFLIRRFMRIVPLAWLVLFITLISIPTKLPDFIPHFFFYANWGNPMALTAPTSHFWSLCLEMQFYVGIAFLVLFFRKKAFFLIPIISVAVTWLRWHDGVGVGINTYYRVDEILAGSLLALICQSKNKTIFLCISKLNPIYILPLVLLSAYPQGGILQYLRPYLSMIMIGSSLFNKNDLWSTRLLNSKILFYIASISYALYVIHGGLRYTWLGDGGTLERYAKRPLLFTVTFLLAHISTFYYEKYWIRLGKKITSRVSRRSLEATD